MKTISAKVMLAAGITLVAVAGGLGKAEARGFGHGGFGHGGFGHHGSYGYRGFGYRGYGYGRFGHYGRFYHRGFRHRFGGFGWGYPSEGYLLSSY